MPKSFFIDLPRCTACRGCQIACKQWNKNPAGETRNLGSHQNPADLDGNTFKLVRFSEVRVDGALKWLFFPDQCRHCVVPPCKMVADTMDEGAILQDEATGAVIYTERTKNVSYDDVRASCPYDIPRKDQASGKLTKCTMCFDRVSNGLLPACVKSCPTGTMNFGDREEMLKLAEGRLKAAQQRNPQAKLVDVSDVNCIVLTEFDPKLYHNHLQASADAPSFSRRSLLAGVARPLGRVLG